MSPALNTTLALLALGLAVLAIVLATIANRRWAQRPMRGVADSGAPDPSASSDREVLPAVLASLREQVDALGTHVEELGAQSATVRSDIEALRDHVEALAARGDETRDPTALRHVAMVRYDAFADVGGRLSYSVALLDDTSSGLVLTTLAGKADVRTYVRTISAGAPDGSLTAEEQQAIDAAVGSRQ